MCKQHSYNNDSIVEKIIADALKNIALDINASTLLCANLESVILGGGYGRGEGGATKEHTLYNDMDFFVFPRNYEKSRDIHEELEKISHKWSKILHIEVDFFVVPNQNWLKRNNNTLMVQELLAGNEVIWGDTTFLDHEHRLFWEEIPWREGARLLLNRGSGLLLSRQKLSDSTEKDFINRNIRKAILGCGDALLIAHGEYKQHGIERVHALQSLPDISSQLIKQYETALHFKYTPSRTPDTDCATELHEAIELFLDSTKKFCCAVTGNRNENIEKALKKLFRYSFDRTGGDIVKNAILTIKFIPLAGRVFPLFEHPRVKLLYMLIEVLNNPVAASKTERYLNLWNKLN